MAEKTIEDMAKEVNLAMKTLKDGTLPTPPEVNDNEMPQQSS
mgnify:CR=1 FL=1